MPQQNRNCIVFLITVLLLLMLVSTFIECNFVPKGRKCRLQEQHCDIMHPDKQCCPGTSCGVRNINNNIVNICLMCRDIGQPCGPDKGTCCRGLKCSKITQFASACNPDTVNYRFYADSELRTSKKVVGTGLGSGNKLMAARSS